MSSKCALYNLIGGKCDIMYINPKCIECDVDVCLLYCFPFPHQLCCNYLTSECALYNLIGGKCDEM